MSSRSARLGLMAVLIYALVLLSSTLPAMATEDGVVPPDPQSGGIVIVVGFILVGSVAVVVAARFAKKSQEE